MRIFILALLFLNLAFTWPWEAQKKTSVQNAPEPAKVQVEQQDSDQTVSDMIQQKTFSTDDDKKIDAGGVPKVVTPPVVTRYVKPATIPPMSMPVTVQAVKTAIPEIPSAPQSVVVPSITPQAISDAQKQVNEIIALNQSLQQKQINQIGEVRRIIDQAKIHQKILNDLQKMPKVEKPKTVASEELLKQEKIRLIVSETSRNKETIKKIEEEFQKEIEKNDQQSQSKSKSEE